jgi:hypothetical protein
MIDAEPMKKPKRAYIRHGLTRHLKARMRQLDGRSSLAQAVAQYRAELLSSLGGAENLSAMETTIVEMCSRDWLLIQHIDSFILQTGAFSKRRRAAYHITIQRMQIVDSLTRRLQALGLQRRAKPPISLSDYLANGSKPTPGESANGQGAGVQEVQHSTNKAGDA